MFQLGPHPPTFKPTSPTCYGRACRRQLWDWIQIANHWIILDHGRKVWNTTCHVQSVIRWGVELEKHGQYFGSCKSCTAKAPRRISEEITHSWNSKHKQQNVSKCWMKHKQDKNGDNSEKKYRKKHHSDFDETMHVFEKFRFETSHMSLMSWTKATAESSWKQQLGSKLSKLARPAAKTGRGIRRDLKNSKVHRAHNVVENGCMFHKNWNTWIMSCCILCVYIIMNSYVCSAAPNRDTPRQSAGLFWGWEMAAKQMYKATQYCSVGVSSIWYMLQMFPLKIEDQCQSETMRLVILMRSEEAVFNGTLPSSNM